MHNIIVRGPNISNFSHVPPQMNIDHVTFDFSTVTVYSACEYGLTGYLFC